MITPQQSKLTGRWKMVNSGRNLYCEFNPSDANSIRKACRYVGGSEQAEIVIRQMRDRGYATT